MTPTSRSPAPSCTSPSSSAPPDIEDDIGTKQVGQTAADGSFKVEIEKTEITRYLLVGAGGHAVGWANLEKATGTHEADIKLAADTPVAGRVIDTEGKPVTGARVQVVGVYNPVDGQLDRFLTAWKTDWNDALRLLNDRLYMPLASLHGDGKTDKDGKFTLKGIGVDRVAQVEVQAAGYGKFSLYVITRAGLDAGPINKAAVDKIPPELRIPGQPPSLSGPKVEAILEGTKVIEGTVTDAATGKPMAGVIVTSGSGYNSQVMARSDKDGKYRLTGLTKHREYLVHTITRDEKTSPYLMWSARIHDTPGLGAIRHDIQMTRGVVVTGRIIDRSTGKSVTEGNVRVAPLPDNKFFGTKPAYNGYLSERLSHGLEKGRFRVVTIPGTAVLMAQVYDSDLKIGDKPVNPFRTAVPDPDHPKYFSKNGDGYVFNAVNNSLEFLDIAHVVKVLDLKADAGTVEVDLYVDRGKTATVRMTDADGKPLDGALVSGLTVGVPGAYALPKDTATVYALDDQPRTVMAIHPGQKLGGTIRVKGGETATAEAGPARPVTGKLVDTDKQPIAGVTVGLPVPGRPRRRAVP